MKVWVADHNGVWADVLNNFEIVDDFTKAERILLWNEVNPIEKGLISLARAKGIPTVVMQHGRRGSSKYYKPFNEKITADHYLAWSEFDRRSLIEAGNDPKRIRVVGTTIFDHLHGRREHEGVNVVFSPEHWDRPLDENTLVRKKLRQLDGVKIITKIVDSPSHDGIHWDNEVKSMRDEAGHLNKCWSVLSEADLVVGISESTFELLAQAMDIPVVIMHQWQPKSFAGDERYLTYRRLVSDASTKSTVNDLVDTINVQLANPQELTEQRKRVVVDEGGFGLNAKELIVKEVYAAKLS